MAHAATPSGGRCAESARDSEPALVRRQGFHARLRDVAHVIVRGLIALAIRGEPHVREHQARFLEHVFDARRVRRDATPRCRAPADAATVSTSLQGSTLPPTLMARRATLLERVAKAAVGCLQVAGERAHHPVFPAALTAEAAGGGARHLGFQHHLTAEEGERERTRAAASCRLRCRASRSAYGIWQPQEPRITSSESSRWDSRWPPLLQSFDQRAAGRVALQLDALVDRRERRIGGARVGRRRRIRRSRSDRGIARRRGADNGDDHLVRQTPRTRTPAGLTFS